MDREKMECDGPPHQQKGQAVASNSDSSGRLAADRIFPAHTESSGCTPIIVHARSSRPLSYRVGVSTKG